MKYMAPGTASRIEIMMALTTPPRICWIHSSSVHAQ